jgi:hypothetical protein
MPNYLDFCSSQFFLAKNDEETKSEAKKKKTERKN